LLVSISTTIGSLTLSETSGLTLSFGYSSFTGSQISFTGEEADVDAALASATLTDAGTTGTAAVALVVTADQSGIEYFAPTGHYYQYVADANVTWTTAAADAQTATFDGQSGYLASIPSAAVNNFVTDHLNGAENVWAGGMSVDYPSGFGGNTGIQRVWSWQFGPLAGTSFTECSNVSGSCSHTNDSGDYYDWNPGEPNNSGYSGPGTGEHYVEINYLGAGNWNDIPNSTTIAGYVVEFGNDATGGDFTGSFSASSNVVLANAPGAPSGVAGTSGVDQATVSWTDPTSNAGAPITSYTVTAQPGGATCTASSPSATSCVVSGLAAGMAYTFSVTATNGAGTSSPSQSSASVVPMTVPSAPTNVTVNQGSSQATVSWTPSSSYGGAAAPPTYTVTAQPGGASCTTSGTSCVITGLSNGTSYTFTVTASNGAGSGTASAASKPVTPISPAAAPTDLSASGGNGMTTVSWAPPTNNGGAAVTSYTVTVEPGGASCTTTGTSCVIRGPHNGAGYTFSVTASNAAGIGSAAHVASVMHGAFAVLWHRQRLDGTVFVELQLPGPGTVSLLGTHSDASRAATAAQDQLDPGFGRFAYGRDANIAIGKAGLVHLVLRPDAAGTSLLRRHAGFGMPLHVRVWISYTPTGGATAYESRTVRVLAAGQ
jgi:hypothetical protein